METYVTLDEAARLEGIKYHTLRQKVLRDTAGEFLTKTEKSGTGGRDKVLVAVSSLSPKARKAYAQLQELQARVNVPVSSTAGRSWRYWVWM